MENASKAILGFVIVIFLANAAFADGMIVRPYPYYDAYEPSQQAVINWDGQNQSMLVATKVPFENLTNFVWILPVRSSTDPQVLQGNMTLFNDLDTFFYGYNRVVPMYYASGAKEASSDSSVQVIEQKEIDIYDIVILKATDTLELYKWLNANGYNITTDQASVLREYTGDKGYFVVNKVDLTNKYKDEMKLLDSLEVKSYLKEDQLKTYYQSAASTLAYSYGYGGSYNYYAESLAQYAICNATYDSIIESYDWTSVMLIKKSQYEGFRNEYAVVDAQRYSTECWNIVQNKSSKVNELAKKIAAIQNQTKYNSTKMSDLSQVLYQLPEGIATPLIIKSQPDFANFPLKVSSTAFGMTKIEVYLVANGNYTDSNGMLDVEATKELTPKMQKEVKSFLKATSAGTTATRFTYEDYLNNLQEDAVFTKVAATGEVPTEGGFLYRFFMVVADFFKNLAGLF